MTVTTKQRGWGLQEGDDLYRFSNGSIAFWDAKRKARDYRRNQLFGHGGLEVVAIEIETIARVIEPPRVERIALTKAQAAGLNVGGARLPPGKECDE